MKKLCLLALLLLAVSACTKAKNQGSTEQDDLFGNLNREDQVDEEGVVFEEPDPTGGEGSSIPAEPEPEVCESLEITTDAYNEEATAGQEYPPLTIVAQGACNHYSCELVLGPEWLTATGCRLEGTPTTAESLGEPPVRVRVFDTQNPNNADDFLDFTIKVYDDPTIVPYLSRSCGPVKGDGKGKGKEKKKAEIKQKNAQNFEITRSRAELCLRIDGYANEYEVELRGDHGLTAEPITGKLYRVVDLASAPQDQVLELTATATNEFVYEDVSAEFNLTIRENPCAAALAITAKDANGQAIDDNPLATELGTRGYRINFEVANGEEPYEWTYQSEIKTNPAGHECPQGGFGSMRSGACGSNVLTENRWKEEVAVNGYQLSGDLVFRDVDLPYDSTYTNEIIEEITVTVTAPKCQRETGLAPQGKTVRLQYVSPVENLGHVRCQIDFEGLGDSNSSGDLHSNMSIVFMKGDTALGTITYDIPACRENETGCKDWRTVTITNDPDGNRYTGLLEEVDSVSLLFHDKVDWDDFPLNGTDHDDLDFDFIVLDCKTPFRNLFHYDGSDGQLNDNVMGFSRDWGFGTVVGAIAGLIVGGNPLSVLSGVILGNLIDSAFDRPVGIVGDSWWSRSHALNLPNYHNSVWAPRLRPDYSTDE